MPSCWVVQNITMAVASQPNDIFGRHNQSLVLGESSFLFNFFSITITNAIIHVETGG